MEIQKTYKLFIDGKFPRTESGRYSVFQSPKKSFVANYCRASRKDVKAAVTAAKKAFGSWSGRSAFNRSQIIYRMAEMLEGRKDQLVSELVLQGMTEKLAQQDVRMAIDRCVYYAGWCDKYQVLSNTVNPVNTPHFNFTVAEPMGAVGLVAPASAGILGLLSTLLPIISGGNTTVVLASNLSPLSSITLAEIIATSDVPGGVINILTGDAEELIPVMASHLELAAIVYTQADTIVLGEIQVAAARNVKRVFHWHSDWKKVASANPHLILDTQELKTTWHPIQCGFQGGSNY